jgi:hypothetical protein
MAAVVYWRGLRDEPDICLRRLIKKFSVYEGDQRRLFYVPRRQSENKKKLGSSSHVEGI